MYLAGIGLLFLSACAGTNDNSFRVDRSLEYCHHQVTRTLAELRGEEGQIDYTLIPRNILKGEAHWNCRKASETEWCSGFWPGILWYDYEATGDVQIRTEAEKFTAALGFLAKQPAYDHDLGFLLFCSYGNGYRLTGNPEYKQMLLNAADTLATLFRPRAGTLLSWPRNVKMFGGYNTSWTI